MGSIIWPWSSSAGNNYSSAGILFRNLTPSEVCLPAAAAAAAVVFGETQKMDSQKMDSGEKRLLELGYKQELKRDLSYCLNYPALPPSPFLSTIPQLTWSRSKQKECQLRWDCSSVCVCVVKIILVLEDAKLWRRWAIIFLRRFLSNFAISFAILSVMAGISTTFSTGLAYGGIISMTWGWLITGFFTLFVGLGMAEVSHFCTCRKIW